MAGLYNASFLRGDGRNGAAHERVLTVVTDLALDIPLGGTKPLSGSNRRGVLSWARSRPRQPLQPFRLVSHLTSPDSYGMINLDEDIHPLKR
jgi:hypothetical protein